MGAKRIVEGRWNCQYCDTTGILGRYQECPQCGRKRDSSFKAYLPDDIKSSYVSEEKTKTISRNPDWYCKYCGTFNSDKETQCTSCGASKSESEKNYFTINESENSANSENFSDYEEKFTMPYEKEETLSSNNSFESVQNEPTKELSLPFKQFLGPFLRFLMISVPCVLFIIGIIALVSPKEVALKVTDLSWTRTINIEKYKTVDESSWSLPSGARLKYKKNEIHHYNTVVDHYETKTRQVSKERLVGYDTYYTYTDLGNGYFEEEEHQKPIYETYYEEESYEEPVYIQVPIYQTKYYYEIDKWVFERSIVTSESSKSPYWGEVILKRDERESSRNESFRIEGTTKKGKTTAYNISYSDWEKIEVGQNVKLKVSLGTAKLIE